MAKTIEEDFEDTSTAPGLLSALRRLLRPISDEELSRRASIAVEQLRSEDGGEEMAREAQGQNDPFNTFVQQLADECSTAMSCVQGTDETQYLAGALPIPSLDAWVLQTAAMEPILVMSHGLLTFCNLFAKAVATMFPCHEDDGGISFDLEPDESTELRSNQLKAAERLADLLAATVEFGNPHLAEPYLLEEPKSQLAGIMRAAMERFLMARLVFMAGQHEVMSCVPCREWTSKLGAHVLKVEPDSEDIIRADVLALYTVEVVMREGGVSRVLACWGVELALLGLQMVDEWRQAAGFPSEDDEKSLPWIGTNMRRPSWRCSRPRGSGCSTWPRRAPRTLWSLGAGLAATGVSSGRGGISMPSWRPSRSFRGRARPFRCQTQLSLSTMPTRPI